MEELNGIDTLREIRMRGWKTPVIVLTQYDEQALVLHLQELGISGFLHKNSDPAELAAAIRMAVAGGVFYNDLLPDQKPVGDLRNLNFPFFAELPVSGTLRSDGSIYFVKSTSSSSG